VGLRLGKVGLWFVGRSTTPRGVTRLDDGQEESLAAPCSNLMAFGSQCSVLKEVLMTLLGLFGARGIVPPSPPRYHTQIVVITSWINSTFPLSTKCLTLWWDMEIDSGHSLSKQQNKCGRSKTEFLEQFIDLSVSVIKPHSFSKLRNNAKQFYLYMKLYTKQWQIGMNSAVAAQLLPTPKSLQGPPNGDF